LAKFTCNIFWSILFGKIVFIISSCSRGVNVHVFVNTCQTIFTWLQLRRSFNKTLTEIFKIFFGISK
jgi:hypothetical protein